MSQLSSVRNLQQCRETPWLVYQPLICQHLKVHLSSSREYTFSFKSYELLRPLTDWCLRNFAMRQLSSSNLFASTDSAFQFLRPGWQSERLHLHHDVKDYKQIYHP